MMNISLVILIKCIIICICSGLIGFRPGHNTNAKPVGISEFKKDESGEDKIPFVMKENMDWRAHQNSIQFKVWNPEKLVPNLDELSEE